jgi:hypothetical protein
LISIEFFPLKNTSQNILLYTFKAKVIKKMEKNAKEKANRINIIRFFLIMGGIFLALLGVIFFSIFGLILLCIGIISFIVGVFWNPPDYCPHCLKEVKKYSYALDPQDENIRIMSCPFCKKYIATEKITKAGLKAEGPCGISWLCWCLMCG